MYLRFESLDAGSNTAGSHHASWTGLTNQSASGSASDFTVTGTQSGFSFFGAGSMMEMLFLSSWYPLVVLVTMVLLN